MSLIGSRSVGAPAIRLWTNPWRIYISLFQKEYLEYQKKMTANSQYTSNLHSAFPYETKHYLGQLRFHEFIKFIIVVQSQCSHRTKSLNKTRKMFTWETLVRVISCFTNLSSSWLQTNRCSSIPNDHLLWIRHIFISQIVNHPATPEKWPNDVLHPYKQDRFIIELAKWIP